MKPSPAHLFSSTAFFCSACRDREIARGWGVLARFLVVLPPAGPGGLGRRPGADLERLDDSTVVVVVVVATTTVVVVALVTRTFRTEPAGEGGASSPMLKAFFIDASTESTVSRSSESTVSRVDERAGEGKSLR